MGSCSYTLTKPCNETSGIPYFTVDTQNEHRSNNKKVSYVKSVIINVFGSKIILDKGRKVQVRGISSTLNWLGVDLCVYDNLVLAYLFAHLPF